MCLHTAWKVSNVFSVTDLCLTSLCFSLYQCFGEIPKQSQAWCPRFAAAGIGKAIVLHFAREGANVAIAYLNEHQDAEATKKVVEEAGVQALLLPGDLRSEDQCKYGLNVLQYIMTHCTCATGVTYTVHHSTTPHLIANIRQHVIGWQRSHTNCSDATQQSPPSYPC